MLRYYKLFDLLARRNLKKGYLVDEVGLSHTTAAKLSKGDPVNSDVIDRICRALSVQPGDIMEYVSDESQE